MTEQNLSPLGAYQQAQEKLNDARLTGSSDLIAEAEDVCDQKQHAYGRSVMERMSTQERDQHEADVQAWSGAISTAQQKRASSYVAFEEMNWPHPGDPGDIEWQLRYGDPESVRNTAAAYVAAYRQLFELTGKVREERIRQIKAAVERDRPSS